MKSVQQQVPTTFVDNSRLKPAERAFNPTIIEHDGRRLMAYRAQGKGRAWCNIQVAELGQDWQPVNEWELDVPTTKPDANLEDPRLFAGPGGIWLAWTEAYYHPSRRWTCCQRYGRIEGRRVVEAWTPDYGENDGSRKEKNWQFFARGSRIFAIYSHLPQVVIELSGARVVNRWITPGLHWCAGYPSGGTPPIEHGDRLLTFFHGYRPSDAFARRYNVGALVMQAEPPFKILEASASPILEASEEDPLADGDWRPLVVFPGGVVREGDVFHVAQGINDAACAITHFPASTLNLTPMSTPPTNTVRVRLLRNVMIDGYCRMAGDTVNITRPVAQDLLYRKAAELLPEPTVIELPQAEPVEQTAEETPSRKRRRA